MGNQVKKKLARAGYSVKSIDANYMDYQEANAQRTKGFRTPEDSKLAKKITSKLRKQLNREPTREEVDKALRIKRYRNREEEQSKAKVIKAFTNTIQYGES